MNIRIILLLAFASYVWAASTGFAVVAPQGTSVSVKIGDNSYPLTRLYNKVGYFTGSVDTSSVSTPFQYKYTVDGVEETFTRTFSGGEKTYNDFFQREETVKQQWQLGYPFTTKNKWERSLGPNGVYDDDYISTLFISEGSAKTCFGNAGANCYGSFYATIISKSDVGRFSDSEVDSKAGYEPKVQFNLYLSDDYHGRSQYKLRPSAYDPSFIREKIYNDVLRSCGCPHQETSHIRIYIEDKPLGLYYLQEITGSSDFVRTQFYGNRSMDTIGTFYECSTGAEFYPDGIYNFGVPSGTPRTGLQALIDKVATVDFQSDTAMADFNENWFDIDYYLRAVAVEYLTGNWDGYLFFTSNFVVYQDITEGKQDTYKHYFIDQDFDQTIGLNIPNSLNQWGSAFTQQPYTQFLNKTWSNGSAPRRTMFDRLLANQNIKAKFEDILKTIVKSIYNPIALGKRIDEVKNRIADDVKWDRELGSSRIHQGDPNTQSTQWTYNDFTVSFTRGYSGWDWGINGYISEVSNSVKDQYGLTFDNPPLEGSVTVNPDATTGNNVPSSTTGNAMPSSTTGLQQPVNNTTEGTTGSVDPVSSTTGSVGSSTTSSNQQITTAILPTTTITTSNEVDGDASTTSSEEISSSSMKTIISFVLSIIVIVILF